MEDINYLFSITHHNLFLILNRSLGARAEPEPLNVGKRFFFKFFAHMAALGMRFEAAFFPGLKGQSGPPLFFFSPSKDLDTELQQSNLERARADDLSPSKDDGS